LLLKKVTMIRILLAEDEEAMRTYLARALENAGYEVVSARSRDRGSAAARNTAFRSAAVGRCTCPKWTGSSSRSAAPRSSPATEVVFVTGFARYRAFQGQHAKRERARTVETRSALRDLVLEVERVFAKSPLSGDMR